MENTRKIIVFSYNISYYTELVLTDKALKFLGLSRNEFDKKFGDVIADHRTRDNPSLISLFESLGKEALLLDDINYSIIEIPADMEWEILSDKVDTSSYDYRGTIIKEYISEPHREFKASKWN